MGDSYSWVGFRGKTPEQVRSELGMVEIGRNDRDAHGVFASTWSTNWFIVFGDTMLLFELDLAELSRGCEIIALSVQDHAMVSDAIGLSDGHVVWTVSHNAEEAIDDLCVEGTPPVGFESIRSRLVDALAADEDGDVDYLMSVPIELAEEITAFSIDNSSFFRQAQRYRINNPQLQRGRRL